MATLSLSCSACALVDSRNPETNYHGAQSYEIGQIGSSYYTVRLLLAFSSITAAYKYRAITSANLRLTINRTLPSARENIYWGKLLSSFDETIVNYNNKPFTGEPFKQTGTASTGTGDQTISLSTYASAATMAADAKAALKAPAFYLYAGSLESGESVLAYTRNASGKAPTFQVSVGDSVAVIMTDLSPKFRAEIYGNVPNTFRWDLGTTESAVIWADTITQKSAVFRWKAADASNWNAVNVSGDTREVTIPAGTFPIGETIEWYVESTLDNNETVTGMTMPATIKTVVTLAPTAIAGVQEENPDLTISWTDSWNMIWNIWGNTQDWRRDWLVQYPSIPARYAYNAIEKAYIEVAVLVHEEEHASIELQSLASGFDGQSVNWNNQPATIEALGQTNWSSDRLEPGEIYQTTIPYMLYYNNGIRDDSVAGISKASSAAVKAQALRLTSDRTWIWGENGYRSIRGDLPLVVILSDAIVTSKPAGMTNTSGYVNPHVEATFRWDLVPSGEYSCAASWTQTSAVYHYRNSTSGTWTDLPIAGSRQNVTRGKNWASGTVYQWYVTVTDDQGTTADSEIYEISTADTETSAEPLLPAGTIESGAGTIVFRWQTENEHGTDPTGATLQYSTDGSAWLALAYITGSATSWECPANTLPSGTIYWRVRASNADNVFGPWSDPLSFVVFAPPATPTVTSDNKAFATVSWQASGQSSYEITVDGKKYGPFFGTEKQFRLPDYLTTGQHSASVRVQNNSGLWSDPGTTVINVPQNSLARPQITSARFGVDARLAYTLPYPSAPAYLYRDGVRIATLSGTSPGAFTDRFVLGSHRYTVVQDVDGDAAISEEASGAMKTCTTRISALEGGNWIELRLSKNSQREEVFARQQTISLRHVTGAVWPVAETGPDMNGSGSYDVSFTTADEAAEFEGLFGRAVIVKSRKGNVLVGILSSWGKTVSAFSIDYTFSLSRMHWRDYVDVTIS